MEYCFTIYEGPSDFASRDGEAAEKYWAGWSAYTQALREAGQPQNGAALQPPGSATTVRVSNGTRTVEDGPYADSKEQVGGFMILDFPSLDEALDWAARCPAAAYGAVEVRPVLAFNDMPAQTVSQN